ncbi:MAG: PhzA/PhzB family protein [Steroidobacteraceae bacterium]
MLDKRLILWTVAMGLAGVVTTPGAAETTRAAAASRAEAGPPLEQTREGVRVAGNLVPGSTLIRGYAPYAGDPTAVRGEDRAGNRATVVRFFALPIGAGRARLYATDGVKQLPALGIQWPGLDAQLRNNEQNRGRYPGWKWSDVVIWNTDDPTVFWVEASGATAPGAEPAYANHYVMQFVVRGGRIVLFREFGAPVRMTPVTDHEGTQ